MFEADYVGAVQDMGHVGDGGIAANLIFVDGFLIIFIHLVDGFVYRRFDYFYRCVGETDGHVVFVSIVMDESVPFFSDTLSEEVVGFENYFCYGNVAIYVEYKLRA